MKWDDGLGDWVFDAPPPPPRRAPRACSNPKCDKPIPAERRRNALYCDRLCKERHHNDMRRESGQWPKSRYEPRGPIEGRVCANEKCGKAINPSKRRDAKACSGRCARILVAHRRRRHEAA